MSAMIVKEKGLPVVRVTKVELRDSYNLSSFYELAKIFGATQLRKDTIGYQSPDGKVKCRLVV